jgi:tetratricopeptide (TPR) repeat protein
VSKLARTFAIVLTALALPAVAQQPPATPNPDDAAAALQSQQRFCEAEAQQLKRVLDKLQAGKADLAALLAKAQAEADKKPAPDTAPAAPTVTVHEVKLVDTLEQGAAVHQAAAAQALAAASRERDPGMQRYYMKEATRRLESARNTLAQAESIVAAVDPKYQRATSSAQVAPPAPRSKTDWPALQQLKSTAAEGAGTPRFDNRASLQSFAPTTLQPDGTRYFAETATPSRFDSSKGMLTMSDGRTIDVAPLQRAVAAVRPDAARQPLFVPDPATGNALRPAPAVRELMANADTYDKLKAVGGVALDITFESLDFARVTDFRGVGARRRIEQPVLLSLAQLYARLAPYATSPERWASLPEALRHPGNVSRVHGFVLDGEREDIFLLGSASADPDERLDVDTLVLALRAVWRDGQIPAVSLDPLPDNPAGPQYPRVHNVPQDSIAARIMLDADYAMKRIMLGELDPGVAGYVNALDRRVEADAAPSRDRFWFHPVPLGVNSLRVSGSGRTWLFDAGLQVLTENQWLQDGVLTDSGQLNTGAMEDAVQFTAHLDRFETAPAIAPRRIFVRLHGVLDAVAVARIWRELNLRYPVVEAFAGLPYRQLTSPEERVPAFYPGVFVSREIDGGRRYVAGGVQLRLQPRAGAVDRYADPVAAALETSAAQFPGDLFVQPLGFSLALARPNELEALAARSDLRQGKYALTAGDYREASARFTAATTSDPLDVDAWIQLALAESLAGNAKRAREALARALELEPADPTVRVTAFEIEWRANPDAALAGLDPVSRAELGQSYVAATYAALHNGDRAEAMRLSSAALELSSDNAEALLARFLARPESDTSARRRNLLRATRAYREQLSGPDRANIQRRLALTLTLGAMQRTSRVTTTILSAAATPNGTFNTMDAITDLQNAAAEAREARDLDPELPLAPAVEAMARGLRVPLLRANGVEAESVLAHQLADETIARFPQHPIGYFSRAVLYLLDENPEAARNSLDHAVEIDPTAAHVFAMRALVNNALGDCAASRRDLNRARALRMPFSPEDERALRECTQR